MFKFGKWFLNQEVVNTESIMDWGIVMMDDPPSRPQFAHPIPLLKSVLLLPYSSLIPLPQIQH